MAKHVVIEGTHLLFREPWPVDPPTPAWIHPSHWGASSKAAQGGRGSAWFVETPLGSCVLRRFRRGGLVARFVNDRYLFTGTSRTRSFREFRLLEYLRGLKLPVPEPILASSRRAGMSYEAALMTRTIPDAQSLTAALDGGGCDAETAGRVGATIRRFHEANVFHADLNAHNVLLADAGVFLIDFDRGALRGGASWREQNLRRLERSLVKLGHGGAYAPIRRGYDAQAA